jgi:hypothetical protein
MSKKLIYSLSLIFVLCAAPRVSGDLVLHWPLDGDAIDLSGNGNDGTVGGTANWVAGQSGLALDFDGTSTYIDFDDQIVEGTWSLTMWLKPRDIPYSGGFYAVMHTDAWAAGTPHVHLRADTSLWNIDINSGPNISSTTVLEEDVWYHCAYTILHENGSNSAKIYINGVLETEGDGGTVPSVMANVNFGAWHDGAERHYHGLMDDIRIYDHELTEAEILGAMEGEIWPYAYGPTPPDGDLHFDTWANLSWKAGGFAVSHDVYFADDLDAVAEGAEETFVGNQTDAFLVVGFPGFPYPDGLVPGTTYYWRIDEVNDAEPNSPWTGEVWSFGIPPKTAYYPEPADGAEGVNIEGRLSWTPGFGAKLHYVYFGETFEQVDAATGGQAQGTATYDPGTLKMAKTYYWRVDQFDVTETHKGDVWSFTTEGAVSNPDPAKGAVDVTQTPVLTWEPGFGAAHELYFGTDPDALELKASGNLGEESYEPGQLEWDTTYYWRVDEANNANPDSPWTGPLWSFTTADFLIIDDFESYNDLDPADPQSNRIFLAWLDGFDDPSNGSIVGYANPPFAEQNIVHSGSQSMPFEYDNSAGMSEATLTLTSNRNWTVNGVNALTIWFRGDSGNAAETLYVALNGSARVDNGNPDAITLTRWTEWNVDLQNFADQGVNLSDVSSITLGLDSVTGGTGMMYFDDIRLYALEQ